MKSFGKILREKRLELNRTIKQCSEETKISKRFIEGLEEENIEIFPGEAYFTGFLRIYAEYLGLDPNEIIEIYKKQSKIEQPIPYDELTKPLRKSVPSTSIIIIIIILLVIGILGYIFFFGILTNKKTTKTSSHKGVVNQKEKNSNQVINIYNNYYNFTEKKVLKIFKINEGFTFVSSNKINMHFKINDIDINNKIVKLSFIEINKMIDLPVKNQIIFDFDNDGSTDFTITVENITVEGVAIDLQRVTNIIPVDKTAFVNYIIKDLKKEERKINILISTKGYAYVKYITDNKNEKEIFMKPEDTIRIESKSSVELHLSNLKVISLKINNKIIKLPDRILGFFIIKWVYNEELEKYQLVFKSKE